MIKAYDNSVRPAVGSFDAVVTTGEVEIAVEFVVLEIPVTFSVLLGRPWFHPLGGVPSTLHQMVKIPHEGKIVTIKACNSSTVAMLTATGAPLTGFETVNVIYEDEMDPKVGSLMKKLQFFPGLGLGKNNQGISSFLDCRGQRTQNGLGFKEEDAAKESEEKGLFIDFVPAIGVYDGQKEVTIIDGKEIPGFEIFADVYDFEAKKIKDCSTVDPKKEDVDKALPNDDLLEGLMGMLLLEEEEDLKSSKEKGVGTTAAAEDIAAFIFDSVVYVDDYSAFDENVSASVSEDDDLFLSKINAMNSDFAYLFDVDHDGTMHTLDHLTSMFSLHSIDTSDINISTSEDDPRLVSVSSNVTLEERERFKKKLIKHKETFAFSYEPGIDRKIVEHRIPIIPGMKPVKQKLRRLRPEWAEMVREEVAKQLKAE